MRSPWQKLPDAVNIDVPNMHRENGVPEGGRKYGSGILRVWTKISNAMQSLMFQLVQYRAED